MVGSKMRHLVLVPLAALLGSCTTTPAAQRASGTTPPPARDRPVVSRPPPTPNPPVAPEDDVPPKVKAAEAGATPGGRAVLAAARQMIAADTVVKGSCWDYAYAVYTRAGFPSWRKQVTPYRARTRGPYADPRLVQAGDWLFVINHPATLATHSVIFVHWVDLARREAMVVTYVGGGREQGGYYRQYDLSRIYQITRPKPPIAPERPSLVRARPGPRPGLGPRPGPPGR